MEDDLHFQLAKFFRFQPFILRGVNHTRRLVDRLAGLSVPILSTVLSRPMSSCGEESRMVGFVGDVGSEKGARWASSPVLSRVIPASRGVITPVNH